MTNRKAVPDDVQANTMENSAVRCAVCYGTQALLNKSNFWP